jgi:hypothetical protein
VKISPRDAYAELPLLNVRNIRTGETYAARFSRYLVEEEQYVDLPLLIRSDGIYLDITEHITLLETTYPKK